MSSKAPKALALRWMAYTRYQPLLLGGIAHLQPGPAIVNIPGGLVIQKFTCGKNLSTGIIPELQKHTAIFSIPGNCCGVRPGREGIADALLQVNPLVHSRIVHAGCS